MRIIIILLFLFLSCSEKPNSEIKTIFVRDIICHKGKVYIRKSNEKYYTGLMDINNHPVPCHKSLKESYKVNYKVSE